MDGVGRGDVVTGDETGLPGVDGAGLPPVPFPKKERNTFDMNLEGAGGRIKMKPGFMDHSNG